MPETLPDNLAALLALWAERYPLDLDLGEHTAWLYIDGADEGALTGVPLAGQNAAHLYLIEGHARACIERAGYDVQTGTQSHLSAYAGDGRPLAWASAFARGARCVTTESGDSLAVALVRLRLSLPTP